jgi:diketogulonate reductase-like aldo/keto reductase
MRTLELAGVQVPVIGQGTWHMGEDRAAHTREVAALRQGIELGMTLIDTAEMYAEGGAEKWSAKPSPACATRCFWSARSTRTTPAAQASPRPASAVCGAHTDHIDLYLLHWRGQYPLEETVEAFERLRADGKIGRWGVSNFDVDDSKNWPAGLRHQSGAVQPGRARHRIRSAAVVSAARMPVMAYCPIGQGGRCWPSRY